MMEVVGYADKMRVTPGESINFMVSCEHPEFEAQLVRLIHGDENPSGPGYKEELISSTADGMYPGKVQKLISGSYALVDDDERLSPVDKITIQAFIYPTTPEKGRQGLIAKWSEKKQAGYGLLIDEHGALAMRIGDGSGNVTQVSSGAALQARHWYFVAGIYDIENETITVRQEKFRQFPFDDSSSIQISEETCGLATSETPLIMAGINIGDASNDRNISFCYNGKIENPRIYSRSLSPDELDALRDGNDVDETSLVAAWDLGRDFDTDVITDISGNKLHGSVINIPTRAVKGHNWSGRQHSFIAVPHEYAAIHFHDDDLEDAGWEINFEFTVPDDLKSAIYAFRLSAGKTVDHVPFIVRPRTGEPTASIAFLFGSYTLLAYANEHLATSPVLLEYIKASGREIDYPCTDREKYLMDNNLGGLYDLHSDGSGYCYASIRKPIMNWRPSHQQSTKRPWFPVLLTANLHQMDWMEAMGHEFDVISDEDIHFEGENILDPYNVVMSDAHPEYWTLEMLEALERYLNNGGRFMYMGGNGLYWVTAVDPNRPHVIEVRRWNGTGSWEAEPGEAYLASTGEPGGLWRHRGWPPQRLVGTGMAAQGGTGVNSAYRRLPDSFNRRASWIFEGIGEEELIGDFDTLGLGWGAAGYEFDRADTNLGTPGHTLMLATASEFDDTFHHVVEEVMHMNSNQTGTTNDMVRADMVFFEYPNDGAVFSTSSIAWSAGLSYNDYDNNVSKVTDNVLRKFATEGPLT